MIRIVISSSFETVTSRFFGLFKSSGLFLFLFTSVLLLFLFPLFGILFIRFITEKKKNANHITTQVSCDNLIFKAFYLSKIEGSNVWPCDKHLSTRERLERSSFLNFIFNSCRDRRLNTPSINEKSVPNTLNAL